jgi:chemotaxis-related protein WspB
MLFLQFQIGQERYLLDSAQLEEVLPLLRFKRLPHAPAGVAGLFDYHGQPVPVLDLSELMQGVPAQRSLSTRLIVARYPLPDGATRPLGLIAENATAMLRRAADDFADGGLTPAGAPYLGLVTSDGHGLLQWVEVAKLLPDSLREQLFQRQEAGL